MHSSGQSHKRQGRFHPYAPSDRSASHPDQKSGNPAWKQTGDRQQSKKGRGKPSRSWLRVQSRVNDDQCAEFVTRQKDSVCVSGQIGLNPCPVLIRDKKVTVNYNVDFCVANAHIVTGLPQKKGVNPNCC